MSYQSIDTSIHDGEPIELYEFTRGTEVLRVTSSVNEIVVGPFEYKPSAVQRGRRYAGENTLKDSVRLVFPRSDLAASKIRAELFDKMTTVTIKRLHRGLEVSDAVVLYKGRVVNVEVRGETLEIHCESVRTSVRRAGLRPRYELICRHPLWSAAPECGANQPSFRVDGPLAGVWGRVVEIVAATEFPDGYFIGGSLEFAGYVRTIANHVGMELTLVKELSILSEGSEVAIYPGCNKLRETCHLKFNNVNNFGGFPWLPEKNPFDGLE